jgi:hypothetical protein
MARQGSQAPRPHRIISSDCAPQPDHAWAIDLIFDETSDRRRLKIATVVDEWTLRGNRTCTADGLVAVIEDLLPIPGASCTGGPETAPR